MTIFRHAITWFPEWVTAYPAGNAIMTVLNWRT
jgi:hypothetical protein